MEPFTMMLGYGLINSVSQLLIRPLADRLTAGSRKDDMLFQMESKHRLDLDAVRLNKEIELSNQRQIQQFCHECRITEAQKQFEKQLQLWSLGQFNSSMWPLRTPFDHPSLKPTYIQGQPVPINVFLAKTDPSSPYAKLIEADVKNRLSNFITTTYSNSSEHPTICRIGDWKDGFQDAAFINALWYGMQGQPSIVINPIQSEFGEVLDLNISVWGLASSGFAPHTQTVISGAFGSAIGRIKREETRKWISSGLPLSSPALEHNKKLIDQEERLIADGKSDLIDCLLVQYKLPLEIQTAVITKFSREYSHLLSCMTGMYADIYHLLEYGTRPYMPQAVNEYNKRIGTNFSIPEIAANYYRKALTNLACSNYLQDRLPYAYLNVASSLSYDPKTASEIFQEGVGLWANRKLDSGNEVRLPENIDECVRLLKDNSDENDKSYLQTVELTLTQMALPEAASELHQRIISIPEPSPSNGRTSSNSNEWEVKTCSKFNRYFFYQWVNDRCSAAINNGATEAVAYLTGGKNIMLAYINDDCRIVAVDNIAGTCVVTNQFGKQLMLVTEHNEARMLSGEDNVVRYDLQKNRYIFNKHSFMQKREFDSFERLGKQLDKLVNNLRRTGQIAGPVTATNESASQAPAVGFEKQITDFFMSCNMVSMESVVCDVAEFDKIRAWITDKLPINNVTKAHILKSQTGQDCLICVFFSNGQEVMLGEEYPKKRILCSDGDMELKSFLNGGPMGTINL